MENPFETGHIKNYLLLYASVVTIMILFFIASTLFHDVKQVDKKEFNTKISKIKENKNKEIKDNNKNFGIKLMEKSY